MIPPPILQTPFPDFLTAHGWGLYPGASSSLTTLMSNVLLEDRVSYSRLNLSPSPPSSISPESSPLVAANPFMSPHQELSVETASLITV
jgi:hypothetical protein